MENKLSPEEVYDLKTIKLPYLSGFILRLFAKMLESPFSGILLPSLFKNAGIEKLRQRNFAEPPTFLPIGYTGRLARRSSSVPEREWPTRHTSEASGFHFPGVLDFAQAYREGDLTPLEVAERVLDAIDASNRMQPALNAMIAVNREDVLDQARQATERLKTRKPLSLFDGVPVAVKDEVDMQGYPTTVGTSFLGKTQCSEDSTVVSRMRAAGALLIGKANMHEIGIGVTGLNPHFGTTRNPYNTDHFTGGSSSGSVTSVAAGLCPVAISADGGGSIRIPSSFCGTFGIKPTFGRVSEFGAYPLCWSLAHLGPISANAVDLAMAYAAMAGPDIRDPNSLHQPAPNLKGWDKFNMKRVKLGVFWPWLRHASDEVVEACEAMIRNFEGLGATIVDISIAGLEDARVAHSVTILTEMYRTMTPTYQEHGREHGLDARTNLMLARALSANDYLQAQKVRTRFIYEMKRVMGTVDMVLTPSTGLVAPAIPKDALPHGNSDLSTVIEIMRFATPANLTGLPAISFPVGYDQKGLPIGMQAIGDYWGEADLLGLALISEKFVERNKPAVFYDLING